jgi:hypothetical protein
MQRKRIHRTQGQRGWLISLCVWVMLFAPHCQCGRAGRACEVAEDCKGSGVDRFCFEGVCSAQECKSGATESCYTGTPAQTAKQTPCKAGQRTCEQHGRWGPCLGEVTPSVEICDGIDNDCDGQVDNKARYVDPSGAEQPDNCQCLEKGASRSCYSGPSVTKNFGNCRSGVQFCDTNNRWSRCFEQRLPQPEICDSNDNDCDGKVNEGSVCPPCSDGETRKCYIGPIALRGIGNCQEGLQVCKGGEWQAECVGSVLPSEESCLPDGRPNGKDENCNGKTDEGCHCTSDADCPTNNPKVPNNGLLKCCSGRCMETVLGLSGKVVCPCSPLNPTGECGLEALRCCGGTCVETTTDALHCRSCGVSCDGGKSGCVGGTCTQDCNEPKRICKDPDGKELCVEKFDPLHCGGCYCRCLEGDRCVEAEGGTVCEDRNKQLYPCAPEREKPNEISPERVPEEVAQESSELVQDAGETPTVEHPPEENPVDGSEPDPSTEPLKEPLTEPSTEPLPEPIAEPKTENRPEESVTPVEAGPDPEPVLPDEYAPEVDPDPVLPDKHIPDPVLPDEYIPEPEPDPEPIMPDEYIPEPEPDPEPIMPDEYIPEPEPDPEPIMPDEYTPEPEPEPEPVWPEEYSQEPPPQPDWMVKDNIAVIDGPVIGGGGVSQTPQTSASPDTAALRRSHTQRLVYPRDQKDVLRWRRWKQGGRWANSPHLRRKRLQAPSHRSVSLEPTPRVFTPWRRARR